jgi:uncharacterized protein (DUF433 family)
MPSIAAASWTFSRSCSRSLICGTCRTPYVRPADDAERDTTSLTSLPIQSDTDLLGPKLGPSGDPGIGSFSVVSRLDRIGSDPSICHGQPIVRGLRYTGEMLLELRASGMSIEEVLDDYPGLERDDLLAAVEFGARKS